LCIVLVPSDEFQILCVAILVVDLRAIEAIPHPVDARLVVGIDGFGRVAPKQKKE
jgi:hypothetical protein